jgi:N-acetylneuraminic acid mutarotase
MPVALEYTAVAVLEKRIYVVGGGTPSGTVAANVQIYDPATNTWGSGPQLPIATGGGCAGVVNNVLYFIGGNTGGQNYTNAVWAYSPKTEKWSQKASMPTTAEAGAVCVVEKGIIYVMGGYGDGSFLTTVEGYDPATDQWTEPGQLQSMLSPEDTATGGLIGTTIIVTDGSDNYVDGHNEGYDVPSNTWSWLTSDPTLRQCACGASIGGRLYSAGGWDVVNDAALTLTESFTLSKNAWRTLAPMPQGMMTPIGGSAAYKGRLFCLGGNYSNGGGVVGTVEIYQP